MKKYVFLILGLSMLVFMSGQSRGYTQDLYYYNTTTATDFNMTGYANVTSSLSNCTTNLQIYADIVGGAGKYLNFYLYQNGTQIGSTASYTSSNNATCILMKNQSVSGGVVNATARVLSIGSPVTTNLYLEIHSDCEYAANSTISITDQPIPIFDSIGRNMYNSRHFWFNNTIPIDTSTDIPLAWNNLTPSHCGITYKSIPALELIPASHAFASFVPFNSGVGSVNITGYGASGAFSSVYFGILNPQTGVSTMLQSASGGGAINISSQITLVPSTDYVAWIANYYGFTSGFAGFNPPILNILLTDYEPNYNCTAWSSCVSQQQTRTCTDTGGLAPDIIQSRNCIAVNQTAVLGFENYYMPSDRQICQPVLFPLCGLQGYEAFGALANVTVLFPDNPRWSIVPDNPLYYIGTINSEEATLGSRSLKLWYIPQSPYNDQPYNSNGTIICQNTSTGQFPEMFLPINTTFMASLDFVFPVGTTQMKFDVKRCDENQVQYNNWCGKRCYSQNCTVPPSGDFIASMTDQVTGDNVFFFSQEAPLNWTTYSVEIGGNAIEDRNYTLSFAVLPLPVNPTETQGNCVYIDNVRLVNTQTSVYDEWAEDIYDTPWAELTDDEKQSVLLEFCIDGCLGNDYYDRTIQQLTCIEVVSLNYSTCVAQQQAQNAISGNQSIFQPINSIANSIVNTTTNQTLAESWQDSGYGFALVFITPVFWIMLIVSVIMMLAAYFTKHKEIGLASGLLILVAFTFAIPELIVITVIMIVAVAYMIGKTVVNAVQGGS